MKAGWWAILFGVFGLCLACVFGYLALVTHGHGRAASPDYAVASAAPVEDIGPHQWWDADSTGQTCITRESPGDKIKELREGGNNATSTVNNNLGTTAVVPVEVNAPVGDLSKRVWTFFAKRQPAKRLSRRRLDRPRNVGDLRIARVR